MDSTTNQATLAVAPPSREQSKAEKAVETMKAYAANVKPSMKSARLGYWYETSDVSFDVEKTESLVSPFVGLISFKLRIHDIKNGETEKQPCYVVQRKVVLAYQDSKWVLKQLKMKNLITPLGPCDQCTESTSNYTVEKDTTLWLEIVELCNLKALTQQ